MPNSNTHEIMSVPLDEGVPTGPVSPETIRSALDSDTASIRTRGATVAAGLTERDPETVATLIPDLIERLHDDQRVVIYQSLMALSNVAEDNQDDLEPAIERLVELTVHDLKLIRLIAARTLGYVALERPELFVEYTETLVAATVDEPEGVFDDEDLTERIDDQELLESYQQVNQQQEIRQTYTRTVTMNLLIEVAEHEPSAVEPYADEFIGLLTDDDPAIVRGAAELVGLIARENEDAVDDAVDPLLTLLEFPAQDVVATTITTLGFIGDEAAAEPLWEFAAEGDEDDPMHDQDLYDLAAETAEFLETP